MSKIRFNRTLRNTLLVSVPVHTEEGLRTASCELVLEDPSRGFSPDEARLVVETLINEIGMVRAGASKSKKGAI